MIDISNMIGHSLMMLSKADDQDQIVIQCFKKDRELVLQKNEEQFIVFEAGFEHKVFHVSTEQELKKLLKSLQRKEFSRSQKLWISKRNVLSTDEKNS